MDLLDLCAPTRVSTHFNYVPGAIWMKVPYGCGGPCCGPGPGALPGRSGQGAGVEVGMLRGAGDSLT